MKAWSSDLRFLPDGPYGDTGYPPLDQGSQARGEFRAGPRPPPGNKILHASELYFIKG
jgi:hypothetical protein